MFRWKLYAVCATILSSRVSNLYGEDQDGNFNNRKVIHTYVDNEKQCRRLCWYHSACDISLYQKDATRVTCMPVVKVSNSTSMMNDEIDDSTPFGPEDLTAVTPKLVYTTTEASDAGKRSPCNCILFADGFDFKDYPDPELGWEKLSATGDGITNGCRLRLCRRNQVCVPLAAEHNCLPLPDKYPCRLLPVKIYECESPNAYSEEEMLHMFVEKYIKEHGGYTTFAAVYNEVTVGDTEVTDSPTETTDADSDSPGDDD